MAGRTRVYTVQDDGSDTSIPPRPADENNSVLELMDSFKNELDHLSRSLEYEEDTFQRMLDHAKERSPMRRPSKVQRTPPRTPTRRNGSFRQLDDNFSDQHFGTPSRTLPAFDMLSPLSPNLRHHSSSRGTMTEPRLPSKRRSDAFSANPRSSSSWKTTWESMRSLMEEQEERVRSLELERQSWKDGSSRMKDLEYQNAELKKKLSSMRTTQDDYDDLAERLREATGRITEVEAENRDLRRVLRELKEEQTSRSTRRLFDDDDRYEQRHESSRRAFTPPPSYRESSTRDSLRRSGKFTPGTKFVAELSKVMDLEVGQHAPLSMIIDRQLERISSERRSKNWS